MAQFKLSGGGGKEGRSGRGGGRLKCLRMSFGGIDLLMMVAGGGDVKVGYGGNNLNSSAMSILDTCRKATFPWECFHKFLEITHPHSQPHRSHH